MMKLIIYVSILSLSFLIISCKEKVIEVHEALPNGSIFFDSRPQGTQIFLQDTFTSKVTPDSITNLSPDSYDVKFKYKNLEMNLSVSVKAGLKSTAYVDFNSDLGKIFVNSDPLGAEILLNDSTTGKVTPDTLNYLIEGNYKVTLKLQGQHDFSRFVDVNRNKITNIYFNFLPSSIYVTSIPAGAQIWINNQNKGNTPDSVVSLTAGSYQVTLKLDGYKDTIVSVTVIAGQKATKNVVLTISLVTVSFGPVRLWETYGTGADKPSGLQLSTGATASSSSAIIDIFYYTNSTFSVHEVRSSATRNTFFKVGANTNLTDNVSSSTKDGNWSTTMTDTETNYVFVYDADHHYSKIKIVAVSSIVESPAWIEIQGIYNKTVDDKRF
ncbi:MAG: PEGA domain-containing protein [Ignavibacteriales bacterium]|nr:PEGA domain-containing protein [Ignavibacteriales bacterium]